MHGVCRSSTPTTIPDRSKGAGLAQPHLGHRWDALMNQHHYLGFKQFAIRGLRYVAEYEGEWLALVGWQTGVFQCRPRDRWLGWHKAVQFRRLHLIANNTRFLVLPEGAGVQHLASRVLGLNLRRLSQDWQQRWGHPIELAETFVDPQSVPGHGLFGGELDPAGLEQGVCALERAVHGQAREAQADAGVSVCGRGPGRGWRIRRSGRNGLAVRSDVRYAAAELRSLRAQLEAVEDSRSCHGRRHPLAVVLALQLLARLAGRVGGRAAEAYAKTLTAEELGALGCRRDPTTGEYVTPSDTPSSGSWSGPTRPAGSRSSVGRNRRGGVGAGGGWQAHSRGQPASAAGQHWETVTRWTIARASRWRSRSYGGGRRQAAWRALLEEVACADGR